MFNLGSSYFHVSLTTVRHLLNVSHVVSLIACLLLSVRYIEIGRLQKSAISWIVLINKHYKLHWNGVISAVSKTCHVVCYLSLLSRVTYSVRGLCVFLLVTVLKQLSQSRCRLWCGFVGPYTRLGSISPNGTEHFLYGHTWHAQSFVQSTFSALHGSSGSAAAPGYLVVVFTAGLQCLRELHLDRTLITDDGAAFVKGTAFVFVDY